MHNPINNPVKRLNIREGITVKELVDQMKDTAYNGRRLGEAGEIFEEMLDSKAKIFFSLAGAMVPAGLGSIVSSMIQNGMIHVLITTGANVVHDIIEGLGLYHLKGSATYDDLELRTRNINRIYDVLLPQKSFEKVEEFLGKLFEELEGVYSTASILRVIGERLGKDSILHTAYENSVPVYCPTFFDSIAGLHFMIYRNEKLSIDQSLDVKEMIDHCFESERKGTCIIGGGVPKNFVLQSMLLADGFDYAIQITTDTPQFGGLSGATLEEAKSWCKLKEGAKAVTVYCDATIALPMLYAYLVNR
jgi:deoxyhypusine synthase